MRRTAAQGRRVRGAARVMGGALLLALGLGVNGEARAAYGDYSSSRPAWLDQSLTSGNGDFIVWYADDTHHSDPFQGDLDGDGDTLPDSWESNFFGNVTHAAGGDFDVDGHANGVEFLAGSWPNDDYFRPLDTIDSTINGSAENVIVRDVVDTLLFCQSKYAEWGFRAPYGLPLGVFVRYTGYGGWGNVDPLWVSPDNVANLADPDRHGVSIHELFHNVQRAYGNVPRNTKWFIEGSARNSEDHFYTDLDHDDGSLYCSEVRGFLGNPEATNLFSRSYSAVFFWKYLLEQTGYSITGQPWEGFDSMHRFMEASQGHEGRDSVQAYLDDLPEGHPWQRADFDRFYGTWVTALYARRFNAASLSPVYYYRDEQENLPGSLERPVRIENAPFAAGAYVPEAVPLNSPLAYGDTDPATWSQTLAPWRSRYYAFAPHVNARFVVVWVDGQTSERNYAAVVTSRAGDVRDVWFTYGEDLQRAFFNPPLDEVGVVVGSLNDTAHYDVMIWSLQDFRLEILYPLETNVEDVRLPGPGETSTFDVHVQVIATQEPGPDDDRFVDGLAPELFDVEVDGQPATVISGHPLGDEYWLVCTVPGGLGEGLYDLEVKLITESDQERDSLRLLERPHLNRMVVIDRSGSMGSELMGNNEKMRAAKSGGRLYTDLTTDDDMLGLVSFGNVGTLHELLRVSNATHRNDVKRAINDDIPDDPVATEHTAMGQGITNAWDQLMRRGRPDDDWRIALLTDGLEDVPPYWSSVEVASNVVPSRVKVDTIALGGGAHEARLRGIADATDGRYFQVSVPLAAGGARAGRGPEADPVPHPVIENRLADIYRQINEHDLGYDRIWSEAGDVAGTAALRFRVYEGMSDLLLSVNWPLDLPIEAKLTGPAGAVGPLVVDRTHALFAPDRAGGWVLELRSPVPAPYLAVLTGRGRIDSRLFFTEPDDSDEVGAVQRIGLMLLRRGKARPVTDADRVIATILAPSGETMTLELFDGGDHGDLDAGDGIYSRLYRRTPWPGTYRVTVITEGEDEGRPYRIEDNGYFLRIENRENGDQDRDGMPDRWEVRYGLDPTKDDSAADPDEDQIANGDEFRLGAHPTDPDTDNGGSADGSEREHGLCPTDFADDLIAPPSSFTANHQMTDYVDPDWKAPASRQNLLYWSKGDHYATVDIYRSPHPTGPYALIASGHDAGLRPYEDNNLVNNTRYYYRLAALTAKGLRTRLTEPLAAVPKRDNLRPWGGIRIVGPPTIAKTAVELALWATPDTTSMRLANDGEWDGASWQPFAASLVWHINGIEGVNMVYVQYRDHAGNLSLPFAATVRFQSDDDGDELGDAWEWRWFRTYEFDGDDDPDHDGLRNLLEFHLGCDPTIRDTDGDGMPDAYEAAHRFYPTVPDGADDADGDHSWNAWEYVAGTDPWDDEDCLAFEPSTEPVGGMLEICWPSEPGRRYTLYRAADPTQPWLPVPGCIEVPGTGGPLIHHDPLVNDTACYRVQVRLE